VTQLAVRLLGVRPGDVGRGVLLFAYLFLVIASFIVGKVTRDALFLDRFGALGLPYVDIAVALLIGVWVSAYIRMGRHFSLRSLLTGSLAVFASVSVLFWHLARTHDAAWVLPVMYVWVGMFGVIAPAQVWTLANYVLTTREARRLFGFVGSGAIAGAIAGGFIVRQTATRFGTESTLLGMAVALGLCIVLVRRLWTLRHLAHVPHEEADVATTRMGRLGLRASVQTIADSPYLRTIAAVVCLSSFVTAVAAWQFKAVAHQAIPEPDRLAAFFGSFNFYAGLLSLAVQWLVTTRLLQRFGVGLALFVVPAALALGSVTFLVLGSLAAVVLLRGGDQVLRYSIDRPSVELLYLPVPARETFEAKSFIDTVVWRLGDGLAGITVLAFAVLLGWTPVQLTWIALVLLGGWFSAAWAAKRLYVVNLRDSIHSYRLDTEAATALLDRTAGDILASQLSADDPRQILYALEAFRSEHRGAVHPAVRGLLTHASPEVRTAAVGLLDEANDRAAQHDVERLLYDRDLAVRTEALLYVAHHSRIDPLERIEQLGNFADFSIRSAMVSFLAHPGPTENRDAAHLLFQQMARDPDTRTRIEAARLLPLLPEGFDEELATLLVDVEADVRRPALQAAGRTGERRFLPLVVACLADEALAHDAIEALRLYGEAAVGTLRRQLDTPEMPAAVRREIPGALLAIGGAAAEQVLTETLLDGDTVLRFRALTALNKLRSNGPAWALDTQLVETALAAEIMGHLRSYQILGTLGDPARLSADDPMARAIRDSMNQEVERIFRLVKLLYPSLDLHSAYVGLQATNRAVHDNALEFLEHVLRPQLRTLLVPLLDVDVTHVQRVALANEVLGTTIASREEAVSLLALSPDPWLQSCAAYAIGILGLASLRPALDRWVAADDALLRETAKQARAKLDATGAGSEKGSTARGSKEG
jgi:ATP:ADP antiporter, AAA family